MLDHRFGRGLVFGVCGAFMGVGLRAYRDGFFMDCKSGSGAFWARRTSRWVFAGSRERFGEGLRGRSVTGRHGLSDLVLGHGVSCVCCQMLFRCSVQDV